MEFDERIVTCANLSVIYAGALVAEGTTLTEEQQHIINRISRAIQHLVQNHTRQHLNRVMLKNLNAADDDLFIASEINEMWNPIAVAVSSLEVLKLVGDTELWSEREHKNFKLMASFVLQGREELNHALETVTSHRVLE